MAVPKYRTSKSEKRLRRSHDFLVAPGMSVCKNCGNVKRPHSVCEDCGHHKGKAVIAAKTKTDWNPNEFSTES